MTRRKKRAAPGTRTLTNADYRRRYHKRHPKRVRKQRADYYRRNRERILNEEMERRRALGIQPRKLSRESRAAAKPYKPTLSKEVDVQKKMSPEAIQRAQEIFARKFRKAVQERIELERAERMARSPAEMNAERDALIATLGAAGQSVRTIADVVRVTVRHVRDVMGIAAKRKPVQLELLPSEGLRHVA